MKSTASRTRNFSVDIGRKLETARTRLLLERPFVGALAMYLPLVQVRPGSCRTLATDARCIYFNADYINAASVAELQFMLAHEALHCALQHLLRRGQRVRALWDAACDHAVNQLLVADGMHAPPGALLDARYAGMAAEEIYPLLNSSFVEPTIDAHWYERGASRRLAVSGGQANELAANVDQEHGVEEEESPGALARRWQERLIAATQQALASGRLPMLWRREFERHTRPALPWRVLLARFLSAHARQDFSFQRISRRSEEILLPSLAQPDARIVVALDCSGSIGLSEMRDFVGEIDALKSQLRIHVTVHACDQRLSPSGPWEFPAWQPLALPEDLGGGGGTRFTPVFAWVEEATMRPDCLLYFTDALGEFPSAPAAYPVLWLVKGNAKVPWGERVQLA